MLSFTIIILLVTCVLSFLAFSNEQMMSEMIFNPPAVNQRGQWYRFFSSGFIHADFLHLAFNMYTLYMFGDLVENAFRSIYGGAGTVFFAVLYLTALPAAMMPSFEKHKHDDYYYSLGASGAVSAVIFCGIFLYPSMPLSIFPIPIGIPAFIFGPLFLLVSAYLSSKGRGTINHSAHIWGALYGIVFLIITAVLFTDFKPIQHFIAEVMNYF
jgi:membrane associated rhomboid family serine protease